ncbi:mitochondrial pyruvate dehydrogenase e1 component beta subunit [Phaffia rhodozyma]|uniref:Pyruvate dehydrogenase E1 component subunit alpha n=1 Tax=Phaffia rhodozyma TaxID=264483 RepID=A0A0F7SLV6_PHARH|nr:mitochondrial pyruvate dehydrogenase e1 component beta subunit [Phaffia rhodozyma]
MSRTLISRAFPLTRASTRVPLFARSLQTAADSGTPAQTVPEKGDEVFNINLDADSFHGYRCDPPSTSVAVTKDMLIDMYTKMTLMRKMEQACDTLYKAKLIRGFCHLTIGQEAVSVGMESAIDPDDKVITSYRCHPFAVLRGGTVKGVIAELLGRKDGMSKGKGGSMHIFTPSFFGGNGIVGAQVPVGAGLAFAQKYLGQKKCTFAMYGDGASNQGQVFEAYNMAKLWNLPVVFTCENNKYGMGTSAERSSMNTEYFKRGDVIAGIQVNAMDILACHQASKFVKQWCADGKGPILCEFVTYRYGGHSMSDPGTTYRTRDEVQRMRSTQDPINGLKKNIIEWGVADEATLKAIDKDAKAEVDQAVVEAKASPQPDINVEFWTDIYVKGTEPPFQRGREKEEVHYY